MSEDPTVARDILYVLSSPDPLTMEQRMQEIDDKERPAAGPGGSDQPRGS